jgi:hypothetical protein
MIDIYDNLSDNDVGEIIDRISETGGNSDDAVQTITNISQAINDYEKDDNENS